MTGRGWQYRLIEEKRIVSCVNYFCLCLTPQTSCPWCEFYFIQLKAFEWRTYLLSQRGILCRWYKGIIWIKTSNKKVQKGNLWDENCRWWKKKNHLEISEMNSKRNNFVKIPQPEAMFVYRKEKTTPSKLRACFAKETAKTHIVGFAFQLLRWF